MVIPELLRSMAESQEKQIINLSHNSILDYGFPGWLADQMKALAVDGSRVILQISSPVAQSNLRPAQRLMQELQPLGCTLSVSEFADELRCRQLLEHLDVSYLKMSPALTRDLTSSSKNQEAVRAIVDAAEPHKVMVIADEVSDTSSLAVLWQCGVTLIAGAFLKESSQVLAQ
jgi:EAL domain-containing protein (putative c-di-GMP-specific phosphodiesterase class I)